MGSAAVSPLRSVFRPVRAVRWPTGWIGSHPRMAHVESLVARAAATDCNVLVLGETGVGKELVAQAIHATSARAHGNFVAVNCGALPQGLVASELFGHVRGAFTGAVSDQIGLFREADGGTLFLDEIGDMPRELQPTLLRALETRRVRSVGALRDVPIDVRIVAATHRLLGLGEEAAALRPDLYHRLATVVIDIPPLRQRASDIPALISALLVQHGRVPACVAAAAWPALMDYSWPGNVRELAHAVARASALGGECLDAADFLPLRRYEAAPVSLCHGLRPIEVVQREAMAQALAKHGSMRAAARALGMAKTTFAHKARQWGLVDSVARPRQQLSGG